MSSPIFFLLFIPLLVFILLAVNLIFAPHNPYMEKNSVFECGFSSFLGQNRTQFSISFFIFALLFLLFDLEILLVYPYLVSAYTNGVYGLVIMLMFLLALTLGFAFELGKKALFIDSRQMSNVATNSKSNYIRKVNLNISPFLDRGKRHYSSLNNSAQFEAKIIDSILYSLSRQIMLVLSCFLLLSFFLYLVIYIFGLISFMPYLNNILLFLLFLIHHATIYLAIIALVLLGFAFGLGKKALFIDSRLSRYESSFLLHSTLINALQAPKIRHFATLTDVASNQYKPFDIIEIYLTKHELTNPEPFLSALEKVIIYDQYYSGVIGVLKRNDRSVPYIWREFYLHFNYSQIPTFASIIIDTIDIVDKTPSEVDVVLYLWPSASGGLPYPKGPSVRYIIDTHIIRYKGSFGKAIIYNDDSLV